MLSEDPDIAETRCRIGRRLRRGVGISEPRLDRLPSEQFVDLTVEETRQAQVEARRSFRSPNSRVSSAASQPAFNVSLLSAMT